MKLKKHQRRLLSMILVLLMVCCTAGMMTNAQSDGDTDPIQTEAVPDSQNNSDEAISEEVQQDDLADNQDDAYDLQPTEMAEVQEAIDNKELFAAPAPISRYTITEKYVNEDGGSIREQKDSKVDIRANADYSKRIPAIGGYIIIGYRVGSSNAELKKSETARIEKVAKDTTIYFVYRKLSTKISVSYPASGGMKFYVNEETYPHIKSDGENKSGYYAFTNESDYPLKVTFRGMTVEDNAGIKFVTDAASSAQGSKHISLSLITSKGGSNNGFTNGVGNIMPGSCAVKLGTLKGKHVNCQETSSSSGYITIDGYYAGYLGSETRNLQLTFKFTFTLVTE